MADQNPPSKWEGSVSVHLQGVEPDRAWTQLGDFCSIYKFFPSMATSHRVDGSDGLPGCIRYCVRFPDQDTGLVLWAKERLLEIDAEKRSYRYEIVENNMGFGTYVATLKVRELGEDGGGGCAIEWAFEAEPAAGWTRPGFIGFMENALKEIAKRVGDA